MSIEFGRDIRKARGASTIVYKNLEIVTIFRGLREVV